MAMPAETYPLIYAAVARVPRGCVATYGQIARMAGMPRHARLVGYALHALAEDNCLPWYRIINARGQISERADGTAAARAQRRLLEREGIRFEADGTIDLQRYRWQPE